jgi:hypothetical protein
MNFLVGTGIGDSIWGIFKAQSIAKHYNQKEINLKIQVTGLENENSWIQLRASYNIIVKTFSISDPYSVTNQILPLPFGVSTSIA